MRAVIAGFLLWLFLCPLGHAEQERSPLEGLWLTQDGGGVIRIATCGGVLCGWIAGLDLGPGEEPERDVHGRSQCGLPLIQALEQVTAAEWRGSITNPRDGRTYDARLSLDQQGRLNLRGYVLVPLFGSTQVWTRYNGEIGPDCRMRGRWTKAQ